MKLEISKKQYLIQQIEEYYGNNEQNLINIFALNEETFGRNFYGDIVGSTFNTRISYLVTELIKGSGAKLESFIEKINGQYPEFANKFNFAQESLIHILDEMFQYDREICFNASQLFMSKQKIREIEKPKNVTQLINELMQLTEEQQTYTYTEQFVGYLLVEKELKLSLQSKEELKKWAEKYIKNHTQLLEQLSQQKRNSLIAPAQPIYSSSARWHNFLEHILIVKIIVKKYFFTGVSIFFLIWIGAIILSNSQQYSSSNPVVTERPINIVPSVSPEDFVKNYFSEIQNEEYKKAYDSLSPNFQKKSGYYNEYRKWWAEDVEQVHIELINVISNNASSARVDVHLRFFMRSTKKFIFSNIILSLIWDAQNDKWLIDKSERESKGVHNQ